MLLSREYPTADTGFDEQLLAVMFSVNGDDTCSPFVGLLIVVCASAGNAAAISAPKKRVRAIFIDVSFMGGMNATMGGPDFRMKTNSARLARRHRQSRGVAISQGALALCPAGAQVCLASRIQLTWDIPITPPVVPVALRRCQFRRSGACRWAVAQSLIPARTLDSRSSADLCGERPEITLCFVLGRFSCSKILARASGRSRTRNHYPGEAVEVLTERQSVG